MRSTAPPNRAHPPRNNSVMTIVAGSMAVAALVTSAWIARNTLLGVEVSDQISNDVHVVQLAAETLLSTLKDAETGQRGFLLTGDDAFLAPYRQAQARLDADFRALQRAPLGGGARDDAVATLRQLAAAKLAELGSTVAARQSGDVDGALAIVRSNHGKEIMDAIRSQVGALQAEVQAKYDQARQRTDPARAWTLAAGLAALGLALLAFVLYVQRRAHRVVVAGFVQLTEFTRAFGLAQGMMRESSGRITFWSDGMARLYGYRADEAIGRFAHELLDTRFPQPLHELEAELERCGAWSGELQHRRRDGRLLAVASHWALHRSEVDGHTAVIEVNNDVTSLHQTEQRLRNKQLKLRLALDASSLGLWEWDMVSGTVTWDDRSRALFGIAPGIEPSLEAWETAVLPEDRTAAQEEMDRALDPAHPLDDYGREYRVRHPDGRVLRLAVAGRVLFEGEDLTLRQARRMLGTVRDVTAARQAEEERQQASALLQTIVEAAPGLIYAKDRDGRMLLANAATTEVYGRSWEEVAGRTDAELLPDQEQAATVMENDRKVMESGNVEELEELVGRDGGQFRVWLSTKRPLRNLAGTVTGLVGVSVEITERKRAEARLRLVIDELNHRVKNTLVTVQSIASQTLRGSDPNLRSTLEQRLVALAAAHDVLTRESWAGASIADIVAGAVRPHSGTEGRRLRVSGPPMWLIPRAALALSMGLHELATNALKYGALSTAAGSVELAWTVTGGPDPIFRIIWTEHDGPAVSQPTRRGFGTKLIERSLAQDLGGTASIRFEPAGLVCVVEAPIDEVSAPAEVVQFPRVGSLRQA